MRSRSYSELRRLDSFEDRFRYLSLKGTVGETTFGWDRWMNQMFYTSAEWKHVRHEVIARDNGCDLGVEGFEIHDRVYIHHMNPLSRDDLVHGNADILDPEFLISVTHKTHNAIHYGDESILQRVVFTERRPGDTTLW